jgi:hypothetical protein
MREDDVRGMEFYSHLLECTIYRALIYLETGFYLTSDMLFRKSDCCASYRLSRTGVALSREEKEGTRIRT